MKRLIPSLLLLCLALNLSACSDSTQADMVTSDGQQATQEFTEQALLYAQGVFTHEDALNESKALWEEYSGTDVLFESKEYKEMFDIQVDEYETFLEEVDLSPSTSVEKDANKILKKSTKEQKKALKLYQRYLDNGKQETLNKANEAYQEALNLMGEATSLMR